MSCHSFRQLSCKALLGAPTNAFCLPRNGPFSLFVSKSWKILLPLLVEYFRMYLGQISTSSGSIVRSKASTSTFCIATSFQEIFHCHCLPLDEEDEFCYHVGCTLLGSSLCAFSLLLCAFHRILLTTKNKLGPSELKVSNIAQPFLSLASSKIRLKSISESSGPSKDSNSSTSTFKLVLSSRCCFVLETTVLSRTPSLVSTSKCFAVAWAASFFFQVAEALLLVSLRTLSLPV